MNSTDGSKSIYCDKKVMLVKTALRGKLRWVLPVALIIAEGCFVAMGISQLIYMPPGRIHWTLSAKFPTAVSYQDLMDCLRSVPEIGQNPVSISIQETGVRERTVILSPAPADPDAVISALQKQFGINIIFQSTESGALYTDRAPLGWFLFSLIFLVWPALLFLSAWQLIMFYRSGLEGHQVAQV